ncbi:MAG: hypothetical protein QOJ52_2679 [Acidimicrobiaceae bacterium]|jgi:hypothetical protein|nr:hypothetical protein [Acidimicrobiaceae bacterium]MDQ1400570.1 hypothetical protein [Acidimicrobiaceae bacterium]MDQ1420717.1 hypothetical protein [Acidimicrobiaceae bacterium]
MILVGVLAAACLGYIVCYVWKLSSDLEGGVVFDGGEERGPGGLPPEDQAPPEGPGCLEIELDRIVHDLAIPQEREPALR